nr:hypothetical protein Iba_chr03aCG16960 [Ipomoea batatas]GMD37814.1 hypothetical protein Iba_chr09eCG13020 [Ipomoea batatas]
MPLLFAPFIELLGDTCQVFHVSDHVTSGHWPRQSVLPFVETIMGDNDLTGLVILKAMMSRIEWS